MNRKRKNMSEDTEPTEKLESDGDLLVKNLLEKQLSKETNLQRELGHKKEFISSEYVPISNFIVGVNSLTKFEKISKYCNELEQLKAAGLTSDNINFYMDSKNGSECLRKKHKNLDSANIDKKLQSIHSLLNDYYSKKDVDIKSVTKIRRHVTESMLSIKPNSIETTLLKFALNNRKKDEIIPSPMESIKSIEENIKDSLKYNEMPNVLKIQKRARSIRNRIESLRSEVQEPENNILLHSESFVRTSKWDVKIPEPPEQRENNCHKYYGCAPKVSSNLYTLKNGSIIKLNSNETNPPEMQYERLTLEEIKQIPKFAQYDPGIPSKMLYIKNLSSVSQSELEHLFKSFKIKVESIKILKGRMKGQAFIEMENSQAAEQALLCLNGVIIKHKPLIIEFGRGTKNS